MSSIKYENYTEGAIDINIIKWKIPNYNELLNQHTIREFRSTKGYTDSNNPRFHLKKLFLGHRNDMIEIYYMSPFPVSVKVTLKNLYNICSIKEDKYHSIPAAEWQYLTTLLKVKLDDNFLSYDSLILIFQFEIINSKEVDRCNELKNHLSNDLENLLNNSLFSDVIMKSTDGQEYKVHKAVLASRSDVLKADFEHNTIECHTNVVNSPFESDVLQDILTFIYCDKAPRADKISKNLLAAADYYQLSKLKTLCENSLHKKLTLENAIETLEFAVLHNANILMQLTLEFIKDGRLITTTKSWAENKSVDIIKLISEFVADKIEVDIAEAK